MKLIVPSTIRSNKTKIPRVEGYSSRIGSELETKSNYEKITGALLVGYGGMERMIVYSALIWTVSFGAHLIAVSTGSNARGTR
jgi:sulfite exporter TauE/SafE